MSEPPEPPPEPRGGALAKALVALKEVRELREAVEYIEEQTSGLAWTIEQLAEDRKETKPAPIWWPALPPEEVADRWPALLAWLRDVLAARYPSDVHRAIAPCWGDHPAAVDALTKAWLTWQSAELNRAADTDAAAEWQLKWRPQLLALVAAELEGCHDECRGLTPVSDDVLRSFEPVHDR